MASNNMCEPCVSNGRSSKATNLCTDCDERLCHQCSASHLEFKAFKSHHLILVTDIPSKLPSFQKNCTLHEDEMLDFYCTSHEITCCRSCIPEIHQLCKTVLPLEKASLNVRQSLLLTETLDELTIITQTLKKLLQSKEDNLKRLEERSAKILQEFNTLKNQLVQKISDIERKLKDDLKQTVDIVKSEIKSSKTVILEKVDKAEDLQHDINFFMQHGTNNQLFLALKTHEKATASLELDTTGMISKYPDIDINFKPVSLSIESVGSISQITTPCDIQHKPSKFKQAQSGTDLKRTLTKFEPEGEIRLKTGDDFNLTDLAVTADNKLLLCNYKSGYPKVYVYANCSQYENELTFSSPPYRLAVIPGTSRAVVTLPDINSIQFIDTAIMGMNNTIKLNCEIRGIAVSSDTIYIGGRHEVNVFDMKGTFQRRIPIQGIGFIYRLKLSQLDKSILCRGWKQLLCIDLNGIIIYQYEVLNSSSDSGMATDAQGNVYVARSHAREICKLSLDRTFLDTVLGANDGLVNPFSLTFDNECNRLFVWNNNFKTVAIYTCS